MSLNFLNGDFQASGLVAGATIIVMGTTGAQSGALTLAGTVSGSPPLTGTFAAGSIALDLQGGWWICTSPGTPGTWQAGGGNDYIISQQIASGETSIPRLNVGTGGTLVSQALYLTYFTALKTETVNNFIMQTGATAAGATPTYCAFGLYSVAANGNLTLAGQCANDTTLFASTFTSYTRAAVTPFTKQAGQRYAYAVLVVSAAAMPNLAGYNGTNVMAGTAPRIGGQIATQSTLGASYTAGQVSGWSGSYFGAATP